MLTCLELIITIDVVLREGVIMAIYVMLREGVDMFKVNYDRRCDVEGER